MRNSLYGKGSLTDSGRNDTAIASNLSAAASIGSNSAAQRALLNNARSALSNKNYQDAAKNIWWILGSPGSQPKAYAAAQAQAAQQQTLTAAQQAAKRQQMIQQENAAKKAAKAQSAQTTAAATRQAATAVTQAAQAAQVAVNKVGGISGAFKYSMSHAQQNKFIRENQTRVAQGKTALTELQFRQANKINTDITAGSYVAPKLTNNSVNSGGSGVVKASSTTDVAKRTTTTQNAKLAAQTQSTGQTQVKVISAAETAANKAKQAAAAKAKSDAAKQAAAAETAKAKQAAAEAAAKQKEALRLAAAAKKTADTTAKAKLQQQAKAAKVEADKAKVASSAAAVSAKSTGEYAKVLGAASLAVGTNSRQALNSKVKAAADKASVAQQKASSLGVKDRTGQIMLKDGTWIDQVQKSGSRGTGAVKIYSSMADYKATQQVKKAAAAEAKKVRSAYKEAVSATGSIIDAVQKSGKSSTGEQNVTVYKVNKTTGKITSRSGTAGEYAVATKNAKNVVDWANKAQQTGATLTKKQQASVDSARNYLMSRGIAVPGAVAVTRMAGKSVSGGTAGVTSTDAKVAKALEEARKINPNGSKEYFEGVANVARRSQMSTLGVLSEDLATANKQVADKITKRVLPSVETISAVLDKNLSKYEVSINDKGKVQIAKAGKSTLKGRVTQNAKDISASAQKNTAIAGVTKFAKDEYTSAREKPVSYAGQLGLTYAAGAAFGAGTEGLKIASKAGLNKAAAKVGSQTVKKALTLGAKSSGALIDLTAGGAMAAGLGANELEYRQQLSTVTDPAAREALKVARVAQYAELVKELGIGGLGYSKGAKSVKGMYEGAKAQAKPATGAVEKVGTVQKVESAATKAVSVVEAKASAAKAKVSRVGRFRSSSKTPVVRSIGAKVTEKPISSKVVSKTVSKKVSAVEKVEPKKAVVREKANNSYIKQVEQQLKVIEAELSADAVTVARQNPVVRERVVRTVSDVTTKNKGSVSTGEMELKVLSEKRHNPTSQYTKKLSRQEIKRGITKKEEAEIKAKLEAEKLERVSPTAEKTVYKTVKYNGQDYAVPSKLTGSKLTKFLRTAEESRNSAALDLVRELNNGKAVSKKSRLKKAEVTDLSGNIKAIEIEGQVHLVPENMQGAKLARYIAKTKRSLKEFSADETASVSLGGKTKGDKLNDLLLVSTLMTAGKRGKGASTYKGIEWVDFAAEKPLSRAALKESVGKRMLESGKKATSTRNKGAWNDQTRLVSEARQLVKGTSKERYSRAELKKVAEKYKSRKSTRGTSSSTSKTLKELRREIKKVSGEAKVATDQAKKYAEKTGEKLRSNAERRLKSLNKDKLKSESAKRREQLGRYYKSKGFDSSKLKIETKTNEGRVVVDTTKIRDLEKPVDKVKVTQSTTQATQAIQTVKQVEAMVQTPIQKQKVVPVPATVTPTVPSKPIPTPTPNKPVSGGGGGGWFDYVPPIIPDGGGTTKPQEFNPRLRIRIPIAETPAYRRKRSVTPSGMEGLGRSQRKYARDIKNMLGSLETFI